MLICILLVAVGIISFMIPRRFLKIYFLLAACLLSTLFWFYEPAKGDDLYRYYKIFNIIKDMSIKECLNSQFNVSDWYYSYMLNDYMQNSKLFMVVVLLLSRIGVRELLPIVFSLFTYIPLFTLIIEIGEDQKLKKEIICLGFIIVLACIDFRFVSCLRNLSAYAIFSLILYRDLIKGRNKVICFIAYFALCELHMACVILLGIRVVIAIFKTHFKHIISLLLLSMGGFLTLFTTILLNYFGGISYITRLVKRITDYYTGRTSYNLNGALFFVGTIVVTLLIYFLMSRKNRMPCGYEKYNCAFLYLVAFTIGSIRQYDVVVRNSELAVVMCLPYILCFLNSSLTFDRAHIYFSSLSKDNYFICFIEFCSLLFLIIFSFAFYTLYSYLPMYNGLSL